MLQIQTLIVGQLQTNCYLVSGDKSHETLIVDPGDDASYIAEKIAAAHLEPTQILATHGHFDHILGAFELQQIFSIPFFIHPNDLFLLHRMRETAEHYLGIPVIEPPPVNPKDLSKNMKISLGQTYLEVLETPGHTPGGVSFYSQKDSICFTGDTVFAGGAIGDWRHAYSDKQLVLRSVHEVASLPKQTLLYPGHGDQTTVADIHI